MNHIELYKQGKINSFFLLKLASRLNILPKQLHNQVIEDAVKMSSCGVDCEKSLNQYIYLNSTINKFAYPVSEITDSYQNSYDVNKWMKSIKNVYDQINNGLTYKQAFDQVTQNWEPVESLHFRHWLMFYEENAHQKYKTASMINKKSQLIGNYYSPNPGVTIPLEQLKAKLPGPPVNNIEDEDLIKKIDLQKKIKSIIGRLTAAERLATTDPEVQRSLNKSFANGFEKWLEDLQSLKRKVQIAPLKAINAFEEITRFNKLAVDEFISDLIFREGLKLKKQNKLLESNFMFKLAQAATPPPPPPPPTPPASPAPSAPIPGGEQPSTPTNQGNFVEDLVKELNFDVDDDEYDSNEVIDKEIDSDIHVLAQAAPPLPAAPTAQPVRPTLQTDPQAAIEVSEEDNIQQPSEELKQNINKQDDLMEQALSNIGIKDVVLRLENLANIFRNREISRQLAIVDLMMDKLGIAAYFPSLGEANSKSLESNQYALTRIEDILSKLRGSIEEGKELDLHGPQDKLETVPEINPEQLKNNISNKIEEEKIRKEKNKEQSQNLVGTNPAPTELAAANPVEPVNPNPGPLPPPLPKV